MSNSVYRTSSVLARLAAMLYCLVRGVPIGTNRGLCQVLFAVMSGRMLPSRGAVFPALADLGLNDAEVRRAEAALAYGRWNIASTGSTRSMGSANGHGFTSHAFTSIDKLASESGLLARWRSIVLSEARFQAHEYEGIRPVACDLVGFFRPHLKDCRQKHYTSQADKALPAQVFALVGEVGSIGRIRLCLPRLILRQEPYEMREADFIRRILALAGKSLAANEALIIDAGFPLVDLLACGVERFVARVDKNFTARRDEAPVYKGHGRHPEYSEVVRPRSRKRNGKVIPGTKADKSVCWKVGGRTVRADIFEHLVLSTAKPGTASFRCVVIHDPRYHEPLVLATTLSVSAKALWLLYRDRWPIEQLPLAAKQMLGAERAFVFGQESRWRLPELALLGGNMLAYLAATSQAVTTGFWDRCCRPTCGRLRRTLQRTHFSELPFPIGQLRKKASPTDHLPKGVLAHRRQKAVAITGK